MNHKLLLDINGWAGHNHVLDKIMIFCASYLIYLVFVVVVGCMVYLASKRQWQEVAYFVATLVVSFIILQIAAHVYVDHRPFVDFHLTQLIAHASGQSFPSDHTTATTAIAVGLLLFTRFKKFGVAIFLAALLIGFARVFVGVHYPIDIAGGIITGVVGGSLVYFAKIAIQNHHDATIV